MKLLPSHLTFIATCNAISYLGAKPVFVDVDISTIGFSPEKLEQFLSAKHESNLMGYV